MITFNHIRNIDAMKQAGKIAGFLSFIMFQHSQRHSAIYDILRPGIHLLQTGGSIELRKIQGEHPDLTAPVTKIGCDIF